MSDDTRVVFDEAALKELFESPEGPIGKFLKRTSIKVVRRAKRLAPVDTGRLRSSIVDEISRDSRGLVARVGTDVKYAARIEFGFSGKDSLGREYNQAAQPFLRPAVAQVTGGSFEGLVADA